MTEKPLNPTTVKALRWLLILLVVAILAAIALTVIS